jgi:NAD(P)H-dependent FMN reductase
MHILGISGSLRAGSLNTSVLEAAASLAPDGMAVSLYRGLAGLPHFNPDLDVEPAPPAVVDWRSLLKSADGVLFSVPEYAHGVPGSLKNALDWVVGSGEFVDKPVAFFHASPRGTFAHALLAETLTVMSARLIPEANVTLSILKKGITADEITTDAAMSGALREGLRGFARRRQSASLST